jgi:phage terminase small subunit
MKSKGNNPWAAQHMGRDEVLAHLSRAARFDVRKLFDATGRLKPPQDWDDDTAAAISGLEWQDQSGLKRKDEHDEGSTETKQVRSLQTIDRLKALELLGKAHGVFDGTEAGEPEGEGSLAQLLAEAAEQNGGLHGLVRR